MKASIFKVLSLSGGAAGDLFRLQHDILAVLDSPLLFHHLRLDDAELVGIRTGNWRDVCLFDGSPFARSGNVLWHYAAEERFAIFGTSAKCIDAMRKGGIAPLRTHDLSKLRLITSTGSPLSSEGFTFVYEASRRMCSSPRFPAAPISFPVSCSAIL